MSDAELLWRGEVELVVEEGPVPIPAELEERIEVIWTAELARRPSVVDGTVLTVERVVSGRVVAKRCPYKVFVARERDPDIRRSLRIRALGVSGVVVTEDGRVVVGRRAETVTEYPGAWELVPSGGIAESATPLAALLAELQEEVGIGDDEVADVEAIGLIHDHAQDGFDICFLLRVVGDAAPSGEYGQLALVSPGEARELLARGPAVPTSRVLLEAL